ncbi:unnamed protein product, partial [Vitis vinifera]
MLPIRLFQRSTDTHNGLCTCTRTHQIVALALIIVTFRNGYFQNWFPILLIKSPLLLPPNALHNEDPKTPISCCVSYLNSSLFFFKITGCRYNLRVLLALLFCFTTKTPISWCVLTSIRRCSVNTGANYDVGIVNFPC